MENFLSKLYWEMLVWFHTIMTHFHSINFNRALIWTRKLSIDLMYGIVFSSFSTLFILVVFISTHCRQSVHSLNQQSSDMRKWLFSSLWMTFMCLRKINRDEIVCIQNRQQQSARAHTHVQQMSTVKMHSGGIFSQWRFIPKITTENQTEFDSKLSKLQKHWITQRIVDRILIFAEWHDDLRHHIEFIESDRRYVTNYQTFSEFLCYKSSFAQYSDQNNYLLISA